MSYSPARVDKNTNNVWKWKRNSDNVVVVVPSHMWKSADKWSEEEISSLFDGTVAAPPTPPAPVVTSMPTPEVEYAPSDDDDEDENFNPNVNDDDDEEESTPAVTTTATI